MNQWRTTLTLGDIFHAERPFAEKRDIMVRRIRALDPAHLDDDLQGIADELGDAADTSEWDSAWDVFYDWADVHRVWVRTR